MCLVQCFLIVMALLHLTTVKPKHWESWSNTLQHIELSLYTEMAAPVYTQHLLKTVNAFQPALIHSCLFFLSEQSNNDTIGNVCMES